jgi:hypothetical protein
MAISWRVLPIYLRVEGLGSCSCGFQATRAAVSERAQAAEGQACDRVLALTRALFKDVTPENSVVRLRPA